MYANGHKALATSESDGVCSHISKPVSLFEVRRLGLVLISIV